jgi:transposase
MMFVRPLSDQERQELKRLARREVGRVSERIRMILLSSKGYSVPKIADIFECDAASVRTWIERFEAEGVKGLHDRPRSGRPRKADVVAQQTIRQTVQMQPSTFGYIFGFWTVVTLCAHLLTSSGLRVSTATVRRALWHSGYRWRRPRHTLPADPLARGKMWWLCEQLLRAPKDAVTLCLDECDIALMPVLRSMWMLRGCGHQAAVPTPGLNRKRSVFGALEWDTGNWLYEVTQRRRSVEFIAFMEKLMLSYRGRPLLLVLDNAPIHKSKAVLEWLAQHPTVRLLYLPTYSGHKQNPVEKVWWRLKSQVAANRLHRDIDALVDCVHQFFASFTPQATRQLVSAA